jgi:hypothetical protein
MGFAVFFKASGFFPGMKGNGYPDLPGFKC